MKYSERKFENMKQDAIEMRKDIDAFLQVTNWEESETFAEILKYVDELWLSERNRSNDLQTLRFIGLVRKYLESENDTLLKLQRQCDVNSREKNGLIRGLQETIGRISLEMSRIGVRFVILRTRQQVEKRLETGPLLPIGQISKY